MRAGRAIESEYCRGEGDLFPILARRPAFAIHTCLIDRARVDEHGGPLAGAEVGDMANEGMRMYSEFNAARMQSGFGTDRTSH